MDKLENDTYEYLMTLFDKNDLTKMIKFDKNLTTF
jgi:hypothetical protein